jgi:hypothetical protein
MWLWLFLACKNPLKDTSIPPECTPRIQYFRDGDSDGIGTDQEVAYACEQPVGFVTSGGDCDDTDASRSENCDTGFPCDSGDSMSDCG